MTGEVWEGVWHAGVGDQPAWERGLRGSSAAGMDPGGKQGPSGRDTSRGYVGPSHFHDNHLFSASVFFLFRSLFPWALFILDFL